MIPKQSFGQTGHQSTRTIFGAAALSRANQDEADRTFEVLFQYGINHIDTAARYGDSELLIGPWMAKHRQDFFLATKTRERTYQGAWDNLRRSLERLRADSVDLLQMHNLVDPEEWDVAMGPGGALEALIEARDQGLIRFIGVTGHGLAIPSMHLRSLERFNFDSVLLPYNYMMMQNPQYAADFKALLKVCHERQIAFQTIKSLARGPWDEKTRNRNTWYEPIESQGDIDHAVHWVLSQPGIFLNTAGDINLLPKVLDAASRFEAEPSDETMQDSAVRLGLEPLFTAERTGP
ncbi:aldo/keto reductase [Candidatus Entotheonella palauensis]|uniref:Aldo/keto reductase n=1 Tax=Candidatus Entotheonella gemina TaxID=1429439 RepID=W4L934_9BACT|nr:aldo/keto reductase [Candidatus Entotheonella palauensis]ETW94603.1 MAG: aldo/keto reductase [Candidatus Entotheonella gemina]